MLSRAFHDDPQFLYCCRMTRRGGRDAAGFELFLRKLYFHHGLTYTTPATRAAIWELPGQWKISAWRQLVLAPAMIRTGAATCRGFRGRSPRWSQNHPDEHHYYLPFVGVDDGWRGRGIGSALLAPMLERCDTEGMPAYLEASRPENVRSTSATATRSPRSFAIGKGGPPIYRMWRDPAPS